MLRHLTRTALGWFVVLVVVVAVWRSAGGDAGNIAHTAIRAIGQAIETCARLILTLWRALFG